ncbi:MAG TPA: tricarballylate utilization 4Fe-4S protein TcuB [Candidatus Dormibacteraeota bacterium]
MPERPEVAALEAEADRQLQICNACRYCEGYCAVFPAIELRREFTLGDVVYLANLCHDCRACYQACMYAPPHELAIDIPRLLSQVRVEAHRRYAWPRRAAALVLHGGVSAGVLSALGVVLAVVMVLAVGHGGALLAAHPGPASFYAVVPYLAMLLPALAAGLFVVGVWAGGAAGMWREAGGSRSEALSPRIWWGAVRDALRLTYLGGGGPGCFYPDAERPSRERRIQHQLVFWGFMADLVATSAAGIEQDLLGIPPPYPILSVPVVLGTLGGLAMIAGAAGLIAGKLRAPERLAADELLSLDYAFLWMLILVNASGLALLVLRATALMGPLLLAHLGFLFGLYATAPYGKFAHAAYRLTALALHRAEEARL